MNRFRVDIQCGGSIGERRQRCPVDGQKLRRIFGKGACCRHNGGHWFSLPTHEIHRHRVLLGTSQRRNMGYAAGPRLTDTREFGTCHNRDDTIGGARSGLINRSDARMRVWRAGKRYMDHAWQLNIVGVSSASGDEAFCVRATNPLTNQAHTVAAHSKTFLKTTKNPLSRTVQWVLHRLQISPNVTITVIAL